MKWTPKMRKRPALFLAPLLSVLLLAPSTANASFGSSISTYSFEDGEAPVLRYVKTIGGVTHFDKQKAAAEGASPELLKVGEIIEEYSLAANPNGDRLSLPIYGNWCGPGYSGPGKPIDKLDTACMHHDKCYGKKGYLNCKCDQQLIDEINRNFSKMKKKEKAFAVAVKAYFIAQKAWCKK
ncbi:hypothetical protein HMPREF3198_02008 [Winkia neuii]|nr:hypothetical protein HMPREF3198_02008 [Winkia neuii]